VNFQWLLSFCGCRFAAVIVNKVSRSFESGPLIVDQTVQINTVMKSHETISTVRFGSDGCNAK
jgi:hypothetical protein